jgi:BTB/POZ domain
MLDNIPEMKDHEEFYASFDDVDADIILRSVDGVNFRVYKNILAKASSVIANIFSLPQQMDGEKLSGTHSRTSVISVTEDSKTLANLLTLCYPLEDPSLTSLDEIALLLAAAQKYELARVRTIARHLFYNSPEFVAQPMKAFRLAWEYRLAPETREAAKKTLAGPMTFIALGPEVRHMEGEALYQLFQYRTRCKDVLTKIWIPDGAMQLPLFTEEDISQCFPIGLFCSSCTVIVTTSDGPARSHERLEKYMGAALKALQSRLITTSVIVEETAATIVLTSTFKCTSPACHKAAARALAAFSRLFASEIEQHISSVSKNQIFDANSDHHSLIICRFR